MRVQTHFMTWAEAAEYLKCPRPPKDPPPKPKAGANKGGGGIKVRTSMHNPVEAKRLAEQRQKDKAILTDIVAKEMERRDVHWQNIQSATYSQ